MLVLDQGEGILMRFKQLPDGSMVNTETGEVMEQSKGTFIYVPSKIKFKEDWFMAFQDALKELAKDRELWGRPRAVLDYLMSRLSFENYIAIEQKEICEEVGLNKANVSASIKVLTDKKIIEKGPKIGRTWSYKLNPFYGWKGRVTNLKEERKKRLKSIDGGRI
jgi:hypothetical protein